MFHFWGTIQEQSNFFPWYWIIWHVIGHGGKLNPWWAFTNVTCLFCHFMITEAGSMRVSHRCLKPNLRRLKLSLTLTSAAYHCQKASCGRVSRAKLSLFFAKLTRKLVQFRRAERFYFPENNHGPWKRLSEALNFQVTPNNRVVIPNEGFNVGWVWPL